MSETIRPYLWRSRHHDCDLLKTSYVPWGEVDGVDAECTIIWWDNQ